MNKGYLAFGATASTVLVLDQATKALIQDLFPLWSSRPVIPGFFDLVHVLNRGAAFGFLNTPDIDWQRWLFLGVTVVALVFILLMLRASKGRILLEALGLGLIAGGALGNFVDRARTGLVVDFLDFYIGANHWPAFNVADIGITVGAAVVAWCALFPGRNANAS